MKNNPIDISEYGTSQQRQLSINKFSPKDLISVSTFATLFFVLADFIKLFMTWDTVQKESWYFVAMLALVAAVILDVPMMYAGTSIKEYQQGLKSKKEMLIILAASIFGFLLVFIPSILFSIATKDATFNAPDVANVSNLSGYISADTTAAAGDSRSVLIAAIFAGVLPLGTSVASLVVALKASDPLGAKLNKIIKAKAKAQNHLINLNQTIAEEKTLVERQKLLIAHEKDLAIQFVQECYAQEAIRIQAFLEALEEQCDPDGISKITEYAQKVINDHQFTDEFYDETARVLEEMSKTQSSLEEPNY